MQIGSQNASQIQNIEGNIGTFQINASFSGDINATKKEIINEIDKIYKKSPDIKKEAQELKKEVKNSKDKKEILEKFEKFGKIVKKVSDSEDTVKKLVSLGARIGSLIAIMI